MPETQDSICQWAEETFGIAGSLTRIVTRAGEEMAALLVAVEIQPEKAAEEAADVVLPLCRMMRRLDQPLSFESANLSRSNGASTLQLAAYANFALAEALEDLLSNRERHAPEVIRECVTWLSDLEQRLGTTLQAEIDRKMAINRSRTWDLTGDGHGYHCGA